jgi:hypothetical protein
MNSTTAGTPVSGDPTTILLLQLRQAFDQRSWHGTNLWGSLRGLSAAEAGWRPQPERHNVWELAVHAAYWKYRVYRLICHDPPRAFEIRGSNFFPRPGAAGEADWEIDRQLLKEWHQRLLEAVEQLPPPRLRERVGNDWYTHQDLIMGAAAHDLYHAGQIQLIKRLRTSEASG